MLTEYETAPPDRKDSYTPNRDSKLLTSMTRTRWESVCSIDKATSGVEVH